jgi:hypothetical protein
LRTGDSPTEDQRQADQKRKKSTVIHRLNGDT